MRLRAIIKELAATPTANLGRFGRLLLYLFRLWSHVLRLLRRNKATQMAAALSYYSIFGAVPLAIVVVLIFHSVPSYRDMGQKLKSIAYSELHLTQIDYPDPDNPEERIVLTEYLDSIIDRFFTSLDKGSLGLVSAVLVIWAALRLLSIIESAFDQMWSVPRGRRFLHRIINYWAVLTLGPLLLAAGLYATTQYTALRQIRPGAIAAVGPLVSCMVSMLAFFLLYLIMPNAKVWPGAALWGAALGALVWSLAKWGFGVYVTKLIPYSTLYGVLGLIPLGVFWVYITWLIVLLGLELAFAIQHFESLESLEVRKGEEADGTFVANEMTGIAVARELALAFESGRGPISTDDMCSRLHIPGEFGQRFLDALVSKGLLAKTSEPAPGFLLARAPRQIRLTDICDAVAATALAQPNPGTQKALDQIIQAQRSLLAQHSLADILDTSVAGSEAASPAEENPSAQRDTQQEQAADSSGS